MCVSPTCGAADEYSREYPNPSALKGQCVYCRWVDAELELSVMNTHRSSKIANRCTRIWKLTCNVSVSTVGGLIHSSKSMSPTRSRAADGQAWPLGVLGSNSLCIRPQQNTHVQHHQEHFLKVIVLCVLLRAMHVPVGGEHCVWCDCSCCIAKCC